MRSTVRSGFNVVGIGRVGSLVPSVVKGFRGSKNDSNGSRHLDLGLSTQPTQIVHHRTPEQQTKLGCISFNLQSMPRTYEVTPLAVMPLSY